MASKGKTPRIRRGKKGKGKRKGRKKKKKKKEKTKAVLPPLHLLTDLWKKFIDKLRVLFEIRVAARRKRIEGWFLTKELTDIKNDNALYHDYLSDNIDDLEKAIANFMKLLQDIKDEIAKAVAERFGKLQKQLDDYEAKIAELEKELQDVRTQLLEFEDMMVQLAALMERIQELLKEIEAAKFDSQLKVRHLTNQFLAERARLHNHLEEQLYDLIKFCRTYLMPILWNFMQKLMRENLCLRWKLARTDEKNIMLSEKREEIMRRRKVLYLERPYWDINWAFFKLSEMDAALKVKKKKREILEPKVSAFADIPIGGDVGIDAVSRLIPSTQLGRDFNVFLVQRLTAAKEAQERHEREKKREEKRFLKQLLSKVQALKEGAKESFTGNSAEYDEEEEGEWEDFFEDPFHGEDYDEFGEEENLDKSSSDDDGPVEID